MDALDKLGISWQLLLSQIVNFGLLMVILQQLLYKPVLNMLEQRKQRIAEGLEQADKASHAAAEAEAEKQGILDEARREAQEVRAQATRDAERIAQDVRSRADQEAPRPGVAGGKGENWRTKMNRSVLLPITWPSKTGAVHERARNGRTICPGHS